LFTLVDMRYSFCSPARIYVLCLEDVQVLMQSYSWKDRKIFTGMKRKDNGIRLLIP